MISVSVVVPARNEADHLSELLQRLHAALTSPEMTYEVIVVDDHSTDATPAVLTQLSTKYPLRWAQKQGPAGKASALMQGFTLARHPNLCTIDADLQYPPEAIPALLAKLEAGADIVIAQRQKGHPNLIRNVSSQLYRSIFGKWLHGLSYDINSGLKVFRASTIQRIPLQPQAWSFDSEFLLKAKQANFKIESVETTFTARKTVKGRKSNNNWWVSGWQLMSTALYHKFAQPLTFPFSFEDEELRGKGFDYQGKTFVTHSELNPHESALYRFNYKHIFIFLMLLVVFVVALTINWHTTLVVSVASLTFLYFADLLFNLFLIIRSFTRESAIKITPEQIEAKNHLLWPRYSIFCPLYKEHEVIPQFVKAISQMDYPKDRLQVLLLLEADDTQTIAKAKEFDLPDYFEIVVVPDSMPKTKPKACNYGLTKSTGDLIVIYDAEDVPDPLQLKKAVMAFADAGPKVICIQAKLNFYNPHQNILTRLFTSEYSLWFDLVLTGMQSVNAPIPLGGTSNHFRVRDLLKLKGWDAFNVTEDCDLGMRLVKKGYRTAILDSTTLEEANSDWMNWFWQRSRWIKGYMQSYIVHMRGFKDFLFDWRQPDGITFQLIVGGKVLSMLINPLMWLIVIMYFAFRSVVGEFIDSFFPAPIFYMAIFSLIFGNSLYLYYYMVGSAKRGNEELIKYAALVPFYWLAMSAAAYMAIYKLITAPHHWSKTKHGLHLNNVKAMTQTNEKIGTRPAEVLCRPPEAVAPAKAGWKRLDLELALEPKSEPKLKLDQPQVATPAPVDRGWKKLDLDF